MADAISVVRETYAAFGRGDVPAVLGFMDADIEWFEAEGMPYGGLHRGPQAVLDGVFAPVLSDVPDFSVTPEQLAADGETVFAVCRYRGTGKATGTALDLPVAHVWDVRDGKLWRFRQFIDTVKFREVVPHSETAAA